MDAKTRWPLRLIDAGGGSFVGACLIAFLYVSVVQTETNATDARRFAKAIALTQQRLAQAEATLRRHRDALAAYEQRLAANGRLPQSAPVEPFFRYLSEIADHGNVRVIGHRPLTPRTYPGLVEQRFSYDVTGSFPNLALFLRTIERSDFWADVAYLKIDRPSRATADNAADPTVNLTISMFSAAPDDASPGSG
jgi:hypothetical protein